MFQRLDAEFHFELDAAASSLNHKCDLWYGEGGIEYDALEADWGGSVVFLNPPNAVSPGRSSRKAREEADKGATVVLLLPVRSDTKWWHSAIWDKDSVRDISTPPTRLSDGWPPLKLETDGNWRPGVRGALPAGPHQLRTEGP